VAKEEMNIDERFTYLRIMQERYREADRRVKAQLLDEMGTMTGLNHKYLIGQMNRFDLRRRPRSDERGRVYDIEVVQAITTISDALDWICAERLQPTLRETAEQLIGFGEMQATTEVLTKLGRISVATVGRILAGIRPVGRLPRAYPGRRAENSAQRAVPIAIIPWDMSEPGHFEVDLVHHGICDEQNRLVCTLQCIDVLTGWSERFAIMGHEFDAIWGALQTFKHLCPIPIRRIHSDNGAEFINAALIACFGADKLDASQTRGRPGYHNDNRFVEQKNSSLVRAYLGTTPLHAYQQLHALNLAYQDMRIYYNLFQPVLRQVERTAVLRPNGTVYIKRKQDTARTPLQRLLAAEPPISREAQERLLLLHQTTNPLALKRRIHAQIRALIATSTQSEKEKVSAPV
jgi:hypothetical protein